MLLLESDTHHFWQFTCQSKTNGHTWFQVREERWPTWVLEVGFHHNYWGVALMCTATETSGFQGKGAGQCNSHGLQLPTLFAVVPILIWLSSTTPAKLLLSKLPATSTSLNLMPSIASIAWHTLSLHLPSPIFILILHEQTLLGFLFYYGLFLLSFICKFFLIFLTS